MDGKLELLTELSDELSVDASALNWQGNQYKSVFTKHLDKMCEALYTESAQAHFEDAMRSLSHPWEWKLCPVPAGPNEFRNFLVEDNFLPPYFPGSEKWLIEFKVSRGEDFLGGYRIYCIIRNEKTLNWS